MRIKRTKPGDTIEIKVYDGRLMNHTTSHMETWTVAEVYPYNVLAVRGLEKQSFSVGQLVQMGLEGQEQEHREYVQGLNIKRNIWEAGENGSNHY